MAGDTGPRKSGVTDVQMDIDQGSPENATSSSPRLPREIDPEDHPMGEASPGPPREGGSPSVSDKPDAANKLTRTRRRHRSAADGSPTNPELIDDDSGSEYVPEEAGGLSDSSSARQDRDMEESPEREENAGSASMPSMNPDSDAVGSQVATKVELYSAASGMPLTVAECLEELFSPKRHELDTEEEVREAILSGMDPRWAFIEAVRIHRALKELVGLDPRTALYKRLFLRLTPALIRALKIRGTGAQQKCVFLSEATLLFDVEEKESGPEYYFDGLHLVGSLFNTDILITKLVHVSRTPFYYCRPFK